MSADIYEGNEFDNYESGSYIEMYGYGGADQLSSNRFEPGFIKIYGGDDNDYLYYNGAGKSQIYGGNDNDTIFGGYQRDKVYGDKGDDWLYGFYSNDIVNGGKGNDWLFGEYGNDKLISGKGNDHFGFNTMANSQTNFDKVKDFDTKHDYVNFSHYVYTSGWEGAPGQLNKMYFVKASKPKDSNDYYGYNSKKGILWYDANGNDPGGFVKVAKLDEGLNFSHKDVMLD